MDNFDVRDAATGSPALGHLNRNLERTGPRLYVQSAAELARKQFPDFKWLVPGIVPEGLTVLAGKPKVGKSWLALNIAVSVASGMDILNAGAAERGTVLYLALEDTERRLQTRIAKVVGSKDGPESLLYCTKAPRLDEGGLDLIAEQVESNSDLRLVIIDTWQKVRQTPKRGGNIYAEDYRAVAELKTLADDLGVAILMIHHMKKGAEIDPLDNISGSTAIGGAADAIILLDRTRLRADAELQVTGRDLEDAKLALSFSKDEGRWSILGNAENYRGSTKQLAMIEAIRAIGPSGPKALSEYLGKSAEAVRQQLSRMASSGLLRSPERGVYGLNDADDP